MQTRRIELPDDVAKALAAIVARSRAEEIILFGSRARGDHHEWSDWDIALILPDDAGPDRLQRSRYDDIVSATGIELHPMRRFIFERKKTWPGSIARWADQGGIRLELEVA